MGKFYTELYKKKLDVLLSIEEFLTEDINNLGWVGGKKLVEEEKQSLEEEITRRELDEALKTSNMGSSSGWDGISFKVLSKFWEYIAPIMLLMARETFREGELTDTFKMGLIKLIPKKGNAHKVGDWRPITLLCCGYKLLSGVVAKRLEKYMMKIIGRAQKGFMNQKNIGTCNLNVMSCISRAWGNEEATGVMCVDFSKAFDSVEHGAICAVLRFFNFGENMVKMVSTLLRGRRARIIMDGCYSGDIHIDRGTVAIILRILFIAPIPKFIYRSLTKPATIGFGATLSGAQVI